MAGFGSPTFDWRGWGGNLAQDLGYGLATGSSLGNAFGNAAKRGADMQPYRDQQERIRKEDEAKQAEIVKQQQLRAKYADFFEQQGQGDWARAVADELVSPADAYTSWMAGKQPEAPVKGVEINGQLVNPITGEMMGDYRTPESDKPRDPPAGYQWTPEGRLSFIPGGPADPSTNAKTTEATRRNQQLAKVMIPEAESLLGANGQPGTFDALSNGGDQALGVNIFGAQPLSGMASADYQKAQNSLRTVVASYLYSVSGATATDEEVKRQTDILTPKPFENPASVADKKARLQQMVEAVVEAAQGAPMTLGGGAPAGGDVVDYTTYFGG